MWGDWVRGQRIGDGSNVNMLPNVSDLIQELSYEQPQSNGAHTAMLEAVTFNSEKETVTDWVETGPSEASMLLMTSTAMALPGCGLAQTMRFAELAGVGETCLTARHMLSLSLMEPSLSVKSSLLPPLHG